ncbi:MAG: hypothetical protein JST39_04380, partial [Bacteroidetes bacterium]|nr:hypothetical protein [Bacteroidota bacterium]
LLPLFLIFFACKNHETHPVVAAAAKTDSFPAIKTDSLVIDTSGKAEKVFAIRQRYQQINQTKGLSETSLTAEDFLEDTPDNGAEMTGYYMGDSLYKIKMGIGLSYCLRDFEFYYKDGNVIFIYEKENDFPLEADTMNYNRTELSYEGRYYLGNRKIIDLKTKGKGRLREETNAAYITSLLEDAKEYEKKLAGKRKRERK